MAVPWWNECTSRNAPRWDWSYGLTGSSIEIQGGPLASVRAAITTARIRVCMATSRYRLPLGCRPRREGLGNVCTSDRGAGGRGEGHFTREGATKAELGGAELARAGTRPRGVFRSALACRRP